MSKYGFRKRKDKKKEKTTPQTLNISTSTPLEGIDSNISETTIMHLGIRLPRKDLTEASERDLQRPGMEETKVTAVPWKPQPSSSVPAENIHGGKTSKQNEYSAVGRVLYLLGRDYGREGPRIRDGHPFVVWKKILEIDDSDIPCYIDIL